MSFEVDQSIKIEQTSGDTVLALSNDQQFSIVIQSMYPYFILLAR